MPTPSMEGAEPDSAEKEFDALLGEDREAAADAEADRNVNLPPPPETAPEPPAERTVSVSRRRLRKDRIAFFVGILLTGAGAFGLMLGSVLHDSFRVPWVGTAYEVFGPLNVAFAAVGAILLIPGLLALRIGLRGGVIPAEQASEG